MNGFTIKERVLTAVAVFLCAARCACGDIKITWLADVTVDRAGTVTGAQSNAVAAAAAHIPRADNPHGVTAAQIGAITAELDPVANAKLVVHTNRADNPHGVTAAQIGALTAELDPVANAKLAVHTNRIDNPHGVTAVQIGAITAEADPVAGPRLDLIEPATNKWNAAYAWGDHALAGYLLPAALAPYATTAALAVHTNRADNPHNVTAVQIGAITAELDPVANAKLVVHTNRIDNPHNVTAVQLGALTAEQDPVANAALAVHTNRIDNPHSVTAAQIGALTAEADPVAGPRLDRIEAGTNAWQTAYGWGDHAAVGYLLPADLANYDTAAPLVELAIHTNRIDNPHSVTAIQIGALTAELDPIANAKLVIHTNRIDNPHSVTAAQIGALTAELDPVANAKLVIHTNRADNPHSVTAVQIGALTAEADPVAGPRLDRIEPETNKWNAAYGWGDHAAVGYLLPAALTPYATTASLTVHTNRIDNPHKVTAVQIGALTAELDPVANAKLVIHTNRADNPHNVTAVQLGALTAEQDPVANAKIMVHTNRIDNPHSVTAVQIGALTAELDPVANVALTVHTNRNDNPHSVTATQIGALTAEADPVAGPRLDRIEAGTNAWQAAYSWGDHTLAGYLLPAALTPYATTAVLTVHTNRIDNPHGVTAVQIGALTAELDPVANAKLVIHTNRIDNPHNVTAVQIGALTAELDPVANAALVVHTNRIDNPHNVTAVQIGAVPYTGAAKTVNIGNNDLIVSNDVHVGDDVIVGGHIEVNGRIDLLGGGRYITGASYISGLVPLDPDTWHVSDRAVSGTFLYSGLRSAVDEAVWTAEHQLSLWASTNGLASTQQVADAVAPLATTAALAVHTNRADNPHGVTAVQIGALTAELDPVANAKLVIHTNRIDNPHSVTAVQIGAITVEADLAALRAYHYGSLDIVESPAEWFVFNGAGTITAFNWEAGRTNVVIPWAIGGVPVTGIGVSAFQMRGIVAVIAPQTVTAIGGTAFRICNSLTAVSLPQVTSIGNRAFGNCGSLTSVTIPQVTSIGNDAFSDCPSLASVSLPQAQTIGDSVFYNCGSLTSVSLPKAQTIGKNAFAYCSSLTSVHMGRNAPAEATSVFYGITPPPTVYVTDPQATGWGAVWNGAPVVRPPLYGDAIYQAGELVATTGHVAAVVAPLGPRLDRIEARTNDWQTAYSWGDHALAGYLLPAALAPYATTAALAVHTNRNDNPHSVTAAQIGAITAELDPVANAALTVHKNRADNPHSVTAAQIGAITAELDPVATAALAVHTNRTDNPHSVTAAQVGALASSGDVYMTLSDGATTFSVSTSVGERIALDSFDQAIHIFRDGTVELYDYETERGFREFSLFDVPTYADLSSRPTLTQIAASNALPYTAWTGTVTPQNGTATVAYAHGNMPVLVVPNGPGITYVTIATDTYAATSGVSRVSLSIWAGENTIELVTNEVDYATAPDIPTNGWGTILFRRVSNGKWKGVGL